MSLGLWHDLQRAAQAAQGSAATRIESSSLLVHIHAASPKWVRDDQMWDQAAAELEDDSW